MKQTARSLLVAAGLVALLVVLVFAWRALRSRNGLGVKSVVLVTLDTVRTDRIDSYRDGGGLADLTPTLDGLAREGVRFERCLTTAPITMPAHASILSGTDPIAHGVRLNGAFGFSPENPSLALALQEKGFKTGAFVSAFVLNRRFGLDVGFDEYDDDMRWPDGSFDPGPLERRGERTVARALEFVERCGQAPFFLWVHLFDPHAPYEAPAPWSERFDDPYDAELAYMDHCVELLLDGLGAMGRLSDSLVCVVGETNRRVVASGSGHGRPCEVVADSLGETGDGVSLQGRRVGRRRRVADDR